MFKCDSSKSQKWRLRRRPADPVIEPVPPVQPEVTLSPTLSEDSMPQEDVPVVTESSQEQQDQIEEQEDEIDEQQDQIEEQEDEIDEQQDQSDELQPATEITEHLESEKSLFKVGRSVASVYLSPDGLKIQFSEANPSEPPNLKQPFKELKYSYPIQFPSNQDPLLSLMRDSEVDGHVISGRFGHLAMHSLYLPKVHTLVTASLNQTLESYQIEETFVKGIPDCPSIAADMDGDGNDEIISLCSEVLIRHSLDVTARAWVADQQLTVPEVRKPQMNDIVSGVIEGFEEIATVPGSKYKKHQVAFLTGMNSITVVGLVDGKLKVLAEQRDTPLSTSDDGSLPDFKEELIQDDGTVGATSVWNNAISLLGVTAWHAGEFSIRHDIRLQH